MEDKFWEKKKLEDLSKEEWEALCDGCGICCLHKIEDIDTGKIYYTQVACKYLDCDTCKCMQYKNRGDEDHECLSVRDTPDIYRIMPPTCAYRLLHEGKKLPDWHYLICGDREEVHRQGISVKGKAFEEDLIDMDDIEDFIIYEV